MSRFFTEPVEVYRAPKVEGVYTAKRDWDQKSLVWSGKCSVQPDKTWEIRSPERDTAQERLMLYLTPDATGIDAADRVLVRGQWWEVDGEPAVWSQGSLSHVRVRVWRVEK